MRHHNVERMYGLVDRSLDAPLHGADFAMLKWMTR